MHRKIFSLVVSLVIVSILTIGLSTGRAKAATHSSPVKSPSALSRNGIQPHSSTNNYGSEFINQASPSRQSYCMGIDGKPAAGSLSFLWTCNGHADQGWQYENLADYSSEGYVVRLHNGANYNLCLGLYNGWKTQGATPILWGCNNNPDQKWIMIGRGPNSFNQEMWAYKNVNSSLCLGVNGSLQNGAYLLQWSCNGNNDQSWYSF